MTHKHLENWKSKLIGLILSAVVLFLLDSWIDGLTASTDRNTDAIGSLETTMETLDDNIDSLRYNLGAIDKLLIERVGNNKGKLEDHEVRIRDLEKK